MHEMAIVENLVSAVGEQVVQHKLKQVTKVKVVAGELTGVVPDVLRFCWQVYTENIPACSGAELDIEQKPAVARCRSCAAEFEMRHNFSCPRCGGGIERVVSGKELYIDYIEGE